MKKLKAIIFLFFILLITSGCSYGTVKQQVKSQLNQTQKAVKTIQQEEKMKEIATNKKENKIDNDEKYKGTTTKETNGWKKYRNEYYGIEFEFQDKEDVMELQEGSSGVSIWGPISAEEVSNYPAGAKNPYIYIDFYYYDIFDNKKYDNLKSYLDVAWKTLFPDPDELIAIKEFGNNNGIKFYEVVTSGKSCNKIPDKNGNRSCKTYESTQYYTEYNKLDNKNYTNIHGNVDFCSNIIDSLQFVK